MASYARNKQCLLCTKTGRKIKKCNEKWSELFSVISLQRKCACRTTMSPLQTARALQNTFRIPLLYNVSRLAGMPMDRQKENSVIAQA